MKLEDQLTCVLLLTLVCFCFAGAVSSGQESPRGVLEDIQHTLHRFSGMAEKYLACIVN